MYEIRPLHANLFPSIGFVQFSIDPANPLQNLHRIKVELSKVEPDRHSLVILPELWATGCIHRKVEALEEKMSDALKGMAELSRQFSITIGGSLPEIIPKANGKVFNTLYIYSSGNCIGKIRKQHLNLARKEDTWFSTGDHQHPIRSSYGILGGCIGEDLMFPEVSKSMCQQGADILVVLSVWSEIEMDAWLVLNKARAVENQIYVVACNGMGGGGGESSYGRSLVVGPDGKVIIDAENVTGAFFTPIDWEKQFGLRKTYNRVARITYSPDNRKIVGHEEGVQEAIKRTLLGQKVICIDLQRKGLDTDTCFFIQKMRKKGDFLLVVLQGGSPIQAIDSNEVDMYAAMSSVDMVVYGSEVETHAFENNVDTMVVWSD